MSGSNEPTFPDEATHHRMLSAQVLQTDCHTIACVRNALVALEWCASPYLASELCKTGPGWTILAQRGQTAPARPPWRESREIKRCGSRPRPVGSADKSKHDRARRLRGTPRGQSKLPRRFTLVTDSLYSSGQICLYVERGPENGKAQACRASRRRCERWEFL